MSSIAGVAQPLSRTVHLHPDDIIPAWKVAIQKIIECVIQVFVSLGFTVSAHALLPPSCRAVILPFIAIGAIFASAFMFIPRLGTHQRSTHLPEFSATTSSASASPSSAIAIPPLAIPSKPPLGLQNKSMNCWINSLAQALRADREIMKWILEFPEIIKKFPQAAVSLPREILFSAEELALHPISSSPHNPQMPERTLSDNFCELSLEKQVEYRHLTDQKVFDWILQIPEFAMDFFKAISLADIFSQTIPTDRLFPMELFFQFPESKREFQRHKAIKIVENLRDRESAFVIHRISPTALPENFANFSPEERLAFRHAADANIIEWASSIVESELIPFDATTLFSETPVASVLDAQLFKELSQEKKILHKKNTSLFITRLRQIALAEQMDLDEKKALLAKFQEYKAASEGVNIARNDLFIKRIELHRSTLSLISLFKQDGNDGFVPLLEWMSDPNAAVGDACFIFIPEEKRDQVKAITTAIKQDPTLCTFFIQSLGLIQELRQNPNQQQMILRYLTMIHSAEKRPESLACLVAYQTFFSSYEKNREENQTGIEANLDSQNLREALHKLNNLIRSNSSEQEDVHEGLMIMGDLIPPELKIRQKITYTYEIDGLPPLSEGVSNVRSESVFEPPIIHVPIFGEKPNLSDLLLRALDRKIPRDERSEGYKLMGEKGVNYPKNHEKCDFESKPSSLWISLKRFNYLDPSESFFSKWMPKFLRSPPVKERIKLDTPVLLGDILTIATTEEEGLQYKLDAFIVHSGNTPNSGHYRSYKLGENNLGEAVWYEMDDSTVREIKGSKLARCKEQAYLIHYSPV
jgi:hypothetical protein